MSNTIHAFTLCTKKKMNVHDQIFDDNGNPIGRVLSKYPKLKDEYDGNYSYDIESSKQTFDDLESGTIKLYGIDEYSVQNCTTSWTHK